MNLPKTYRLIREEDVPELSAKAYLLHHVKSGAHLLLIDTADDNKVFSITFRTTPDDSTGVPHIMEHSVLCGSDKYPLKDPFIELAKGSLNTFLNAMTWPDKTMYPIASRNEKDFENLMSVYMDAVFRPNIYKTDKILKQEGWHYELDDPDGEIRYNGVVYNEMRGAFSDPDTVLENAMAKYLYPGTTYEVVSGGDPKDIPNLTYEQFIAFHKRYYHPSNSYIYLYGDMDFEARLNWLDEAYLKEYDAIDPKTDIPLTAPFDAVVRNHCYYNVSTGEVENHSVFQYARAVGELFDPVKSLAFQVLGYALLNAPGAPIKQALLDAGIGDDIYGGYDSSYREPDFAVTAKGTDPKDFDRFLSIIDETIAKVVKEGIPERTLLAGINNIEFSLREADYGRMPKGLVYCIAIVETWLHEDEKALVHFHYDESFRTLKSLVGTDYFVKLAEEALLKNPHGVATLMEAKEGLTEAEDEAIREKLAAKKAAMTAEEIERLIEETKELKAYQDAPDPKEALESIPLLKLSDVDPKPMQYPNEETEIAGIRTLFHEVATNGIGYVNFRFSLKNVELPDFPYIGLLKYFYTMMSTEKYSYRELSDEISYRTGGISAAPQILCSEKDDTILETLNASARYLVENTAETMELMAEIFHRTNFTETDRMKELLSEYRSGLQETLVAAGSLTASRRALSYGSRASYEEELLQGLSFFRLLDRVEKKFEQSLPAKMKELQEKIFTKKNLLISFTGSRAELEALKQHADRFLGTLSEGNDVHAGRNFAPAKKNEGIKTSSMVQYTALGGNFKKHGFNYTGALNVLRTILRYEYLWMNIRVKGG
ncbi:MAG: insulinase family protein, partial [Lachnospiraceae bacterium]|nr:insulinase family protein [Lachnospiraceae bacterium]